MTHGKTFAPGTVIDGRYEVERKLGRGGFASVYKTTHLQLERPAAVKVLDPVTDGDADEFYERFVREAKIAANLGHPHVVTIFDFGRIDETDQPYISMELLDGRDLEVELTHMGALDPDRAKRLLMPCLEALQEGHEKGIVHKDIKPANLFIVHPGTDAERMVVLDFGIARLNQDPEEQLTQAGSFSGTPAYLAPEYIRHQEVTPAVDVYQMGLIFIEALSGTQVIQADSSMHYLVKHCNGEHEVPEELKETPLGRVLMRAIEVDPSARYRNAGEFRRALLEIDTATWTSLSLPKKLPRVAESDGPPPDRSIGHSETLPSSPGMSAPEEEAGPADGGISPPGQPPGMSTAEVVGSKSSGKSLLALVAIAAFVILLVLIVGGVGAGFLIYQKYAKPDQPLTTQLSSLVGEGGEGRTERAGGARPPAVTEKSQNTKEPDLQELLGGDRTANKLASHLVGINMVRNFSYQVAMYEASIDKWGIDSKSVAAPQGIATSLEHGMQNIEKAIDMGPDLPVDRSASVYLDQLRRVEPLLTEISDFYHVEGGIEAGSVREARTLHRRTRKAWPAYQRAFEEFQSDVLRSYRRYLKQNLSRFGNDPYMKLATEIVLNAVEIAAMVEKTPRSKEIGELAAWMKKKLDRLRAYQRSHRKELRKRFEISGGTGFSVHGQFVPSGRSFLSSLRTFREEMSKPKRPSDWTPRGNTAFVQQGVYSLANQYNQLLRHGD